MMAQRVPPPFRPLGAIARETLPEQVRRPIREPHPVAAAKRLAREIASLDYDEPTITEPILVPRAHPLLVITADITIPQTPGYARRLGNLLLALRTTVEEHAPWLANVDIEVKR